MVSVLCIKLVKMEDNDERVVGISSLNPKPLGEGCSIFIVDEDANCISQFNVPKGRKKYHVSMTYSGCKRKGEEYLQDCKRLKKKHEK